MNTGQALESLETRVAFQEQSIKELSDELYRQQQQIVALEQACRLLAAQLKAVAKDGGGAIGDDAPPPHY
jgi:SlyX protein